jgi:hypothetical protein
MARCEISNVCIRCAGSHLLATCGRAGVDSCLPIGERGRGSLRGNPCALDRAYAPYMCPHCGYSDITTVIRGGRVVGWACGWCH